MNKLRSLAKIISSLGLLEDYASILKIGTLHGVMTLGIPEESARLINELAGDKWDYVVGKWMLESNLWGGQDIRKTHPPPSSGVRYNLVWKMKALDGCRVLLQTDLESRSGLIGGRSNNSVSALSTWLREQDIGIEGAYKRRELSEWDKIYLRMERAPEPDEIMRAWADEIRPLVISGIKDFLSSEFISAVVSGGWLSPKVLRGMGYEEAMAAWVENRSDEYPTVLGFKNGWRWCDAGGGRSDWVCRKLKNCGNSSWGNLRATKESGESARMLILIGERGEPHGIVTWNPEYVDYEDREGKKRRYLGGVQGVGSQPIKDEYYSYVLALVDYLKPDVIKIERSSVRHESGKEVDNQNLINLINPDLLML